MQVKTFKIEDGVEEKVNQFLQDNSDYLSESGVHVFPDRMVFITMSKFDPVEQTRLLKIDSHRKRYVEILKLIADNDFKLKWYANLPPETNVGERDGGSLGHSKAIIQVNAKQAVDYITSDNKMLVIEKEALEQILNELINARSKESG